MKRFLIVLLSAAAFVNVDGGDAKDIQVAYENCKKEFSFTGESDGTCNYGENDEKYKCTVACTGIAMKLATEKGEILGDQIVQMIDDAVKNMTQKDQENSAEEIKKVKSTIQTCLVQAKDFTDNGPPCNGKPGGERMWVFSKCMCEKMKPKEK